MYYLFRSQIMAVLSQLPLTTILKAWHSSMQVMESLCPWSRTLEPRTSMPASWKTKDRTDSHAFFSTRRRNIADGLFVVVHALALVMSRLTPVKCNRQHKRWRWDYTLKKIVRLTSVLKCLRFRRPFEPAVRRGSAVLEADKVVLSTEP